MHTKDILAEALRGVGLNDMAEKAATGWYHDYLSPLDLPDLQLEADLRAARDACPDAARATRIEYVRQRHLSGAFDANREEADAWANSPDGRAAFDMLARDARKGRA